MCDVSLSLNFKLHYLSLGDFHQVPALSDKSPCCDLIDFVLLDLPLCRLIQHTFIVLFLYNRCEQFLDDLSWQLLESADLSLDSRYDTLEPGLHNQLETGRFVRFPTRIEFLCAQFLQTGVQVPRSALVFAVVRVPETENRVEHVIQQFRLVAILEIKSVPPEELVHGLSILRELPIASGRCKEYAKFETILFLQIEGYLDPLFLLMIIEDEALSFREALFKGCQEVLRD